MVRCCTCMRWFHVPCVNDDTGGVWNCLSCRTLPHNVKELMELVKALTTEFEVYKTQSSSAIQQLANECRELREENKKLSAQMSTCSTSLTQAPSAHTSPPKSFADVVKSSVQSVLREEKVKSDVILINAKDNKQDTRDVKELCSDIGFPSQPIGAQRLGKSQADRSRLLKVSFGSAFDARAFQAKFEEARKEENPKVRGIRCRPGRTKAEQEKFSKLATTVHQLNQRTIEGESYNLRQNGQIWKFAQDGEGRWKRVADWSHGPMSSDSGNSPQTPAPQC